MTVTIWARIEAARQRWSTNGDLAVADESDEDRFAAAERACRANWRLPDGI